MAVEIHAWIEPSDAPEVGANRRLVAEADLPQGMWQGPHQFFVMTEGKLKKRIAWVDYEYIWIRPGDGDEFTAEEMNFLERLFVQMGPTARFYEHMGLFDAPHFALISHHRGRRKEYLAQLRQNCIGLRGKLILSKAPDLASFCRSSR